MPSPIIDKLRELNEKKPKAFHMPGHKRKKKFIPFEPVSFDITEISEFDNLHNPKGIIAESCKYCAEVFGADRSFYLVNGSTSGLMAAIYAVSGENNKILIARNAHKSVYSGLLLSGAEPVYIIPEKTFFGTYGGVNPEDVKTALEKNPEIKGVVITSPSYEGLCSDIGEIAKIVHKKNIPLIVDEAHGAHFKFSDKFPKTALEEGADIVVQSLHKTLPAFTQCSVLHLKRGLVDENKIAFALSLFTTTSPSYIFMAAIDNCQNLLSAKGGELFSKYTHNLYSFYEKMKKLENIKILKKGDILGKSSVCDKDGGKIVCICRKKNIFTVEKKLEKNYNINIEAKGERHIILMSSVCDEKEDFDALAYALLKIDQGVDKNIDKNVYEQDSYIKEENPVRAMTLREAFYMRKEKVLADKSAGRICAEFIIPYPPGVPLIVPGEVITAGILERINILKASGTEFIGPENSALDSFNVIV